MRGVDMDSGLKEELQNTEPIDAFSMKRSTLLGKQRSVQSSTKKFQQRVSST